jgi:hypothetical protein
MAALIGKAAPRGRVPSEADNRKREIGLRLTDAVKGARQRAKVRGLNFDIDVDWVLAQAEKQRHRCALTGIPFLAPVKSASSRSPFAPSLDRIEPSKGYTKDNLRIVVLAVNVMMLDWGCDLFERVVSGYSFTKRTKAKSLFPHLSGQSPHLKNSREKSI